MRMPRGTERSDRWRSTSDHSRAPPACRRPRHASSNIALDTRAFSTTYPTIACRRTWHLLCSLCPARRDDMRRRRTNRQSGAVWLLTTALVLGGFSEAKAQGNPTNTTFEIYGFAMLDIGHNFKQINPNWFDTMRVTRLPSFGDEFCCDNNTFAGVRQSRLGVRSSTPTVLGDLKTTFEFELFVTGVDEGQTTFRLRHAYGEVGAFGAGQTWSPFMDPDVFPNSLEYWGPTGMVFFRNVQVRYMPFSGDRSLTLALERPGASGDAGVYASRIELQNIRPRFPLPDFSGAYKQTEKWGYVRAAGMIRLIKYDDVLAERFELSGDAKGWGNNPS